MPRLAGELLQVFAQFITRVGFAFFKKKLNKLSNLSFSK